MKRGILFFVVCWCALLFSQANAYDYFPTAVGLGGSNYAFTTGVDALRTNPANLLLPRKGKNELVFLLPNAGAFFFNNTIPNSVYWHYNRKYIDNEEDFINGSQDAFMEHLDKDTWFNVGGNYDLFALTWGRFGFRSSIVSHSRVFVDKNESHKGNDNLSQKILDPNYTTHGISDSTSKDRADFQEETAESFSVIENSFGWAIPIEDRGIPLNSIFNMPKASFGINFKYLMGISYAKLEENVTVRDTLGTTKLYRGSYMDVTSAGSPLEIKDDSTGIEDLESGIGGHGFAFDVGMNWYDDQTSYSLSLNNILGFVYWFNDVYEDKIYGYNHVGQEVNGRISVNDKVRLYTDDENNEVKDKSGLFTPYPMTLNFGFAHRIPIESKIQWLSNSVVLMGSVQQGFWNSASTTLVPRISFGVQNGFLYDVVPLRLGIGFGGDEDVTFSAGFGVDMKYLVFDAGIRGYKSVMAHESKGVAAGAGFKFVFGYDGDPDGDGLLNSVDECDDDPEDFDGFQDEDGCPDYDNDQDNIPDTVDLCPLTPEDFDGFQDQDGCPDYDNDKDGIPDSLDQCPDVPEDIDSFEDEDGCPDYDNDKDGIPDSLDQCPNEPGLKKDNGCPVYDRDKDGIPDSVDQCPEIPETYNNYMDDDGCPDTPPAPKKQEIKMIKQALKGIKFKVNSYKILPSTIGQLDQIVLVLKNYEYLRYEIQGHTDITGAYEYNMVLSRMRAESVKKYLVSKGIAPERFIVIGYGPDQPIATNKTSAGRKLNRRIEFIQILSNDDLEKLKDKSKFNDQTIDEILKKKPSYKRKLGL